MIIRRRRRTPISHRTPHPARLIGAAVIGVLAVLCGCAVRPPTPVSTPVDLPDTFSAGGTAEVPATWWTALGDRRLDALVERAFRDNFSLRTAWDRLDQARAVARKRGADLKPTVDGSAEASRTVTKNEGMDRAYATEFSLGLAAGYEVDLWGRLRAERDAAALDAIASREDLSAAAMTLSAEVAHTWYQLVEQRRQIELLDAQIATNEKYLEVITLRFRRGKVSAADVLQQRQLVEARKGDRVLAVSAAEVLEHRLAVLLGRAPGTLDLAVSDSLPVIPALPETGVPAEWVRARPDVRAAELRVRAADRSVGAAIADRFPKLSVTARAETAAGEIGDLFDNWLARLAGNLTAPLVDGGRRQAEVDRTRAVLSQRLNSYGDTVLHALKEVEDALVQEARQAEYVASVRRQLDLSRRATERTLDSYIKGPLDFTRYLTTLLEHQRLQRTVLQARRRRVQYRIDLYRALAQSWAPERSEQPNNATRPER
ncbi:MAG: TolC family protein [Planctomycetota bacterium]